jgi:hypothetical protein
LVRVYPGVYAVGYRRRRWPRAPEVSLIGDRRPRGIYVHRCAAIAPGDRDRQLGVPVTTPERTLDDLRPRLTSEEFRRAVSDAAYDKLIDADAVVRLLGHAAVPPTRSGPYQLGTPAEGGRRDRGTIAAVARTANAAMNPAR